MPGPGAAGLRGQRFGVVVRCVNGGTGAVGSALALYEGRICDGVRGVACVETGQGGMRDGSMTVTLSDEARRVLALFEDVTGATGRDCLVYDDRVVVLVTRGDMVEAIGPGGEHVRAVEDELDVEVKLVEDATTPADFVANALAPAAVYNVTISENGDTVAYVEVDEADTGVAIGVDGRNIEAARELARRHVDVDDIELT